MPAVINPLRLDILILSVHSKRFRQQRPAAGVSAVVQGYACVALRLVMAHPVETVAALTRDGAEEWGLQLDPGSGGNVRRRK